MDPTLSAVWPLAPQSVSPRAVGLRVRMGSWLIARLFAWRLLTNFISLIPIGARNSLRKVTPECVGNPCLGRMVLPR